jgi:peroxiredoxin/predicted 2-oxoglutarate/Fe(II)-dependent dioxygenase YbiX
MTSAKIGTNLDEQAMPPFGEGDMLPDIILPNSRGKLVQFLTQVTNNRQVLLFCPDPRLPACRAQLRNFAERFKELKPFAVVFGITSTAPAENAAFLEQDPLPFQLLSDLERQVAKGLGITHNLEDPLSADGAGAFSIVVNDVNRRVLKVIRDITDPDSAPGIIEFLANLPQRQARALSHFAPLLYVPEVFEPEFCRALIKAFDEGETQQTGVHQAKGTLGKSERVIDPSRKARRDHLVIDPILLDGIRRRLDRRVVPEIQKAFTRRVTGVEQYKVVRYDAEEGGHFAAHRDNVVKHHAHRRFALTLNLNREEYEGGGLLFPEYGPDIYAPATGDAVIFSCSLLHQATPVSKGHRYVLLAFFLDEESRQFNDRFRD